MLLIFAYCWSGKVGLCRAVLCRAVGRQRCPLSTGWAALATAAKDRNQHWWGGSVRLSVRLSVDLSAPAALRSRPLRAAPTDTLGRKNGALNQRRPIPT